ncbi:hypothetical protein PMAYCL1PPCAC_09712, partial [Pristionchus mayeri]
SVDCAEFSKLSLGEGVQVAGKNLSCSDNSKIVKTSSGIHSPSFVCDVNTGLYKFGDKIVSKGEIITCE